MFWKKKQPSLPREIPPHALQAVPHRNPSVEAREDKVSGKLYLRYPVIPPSSFEKWISGKMNWKRYRRFDMDATGKRFWDLLDGSRRLVDIELIMRKEFAWQKKKGREGILAYTTTLMRRKLIFLDLEYLETKKS